MKLYFRHSNGDMDYVGDVEGVASGCDLALKDLKDRAPHFTSYYQRYWTDGQSLHG